MKRVKILFFLVIACFSFVSFAIYPSFFNNKTEDFDIACEIIEYLIGSKFDPAQSKILVNVNIGSNARQCLITVKSRPIDQKNSQRILFSNKTSVRDLLLNEKISIKKICDDNYSIFFENYITRKPVSFSLQFQQYLKEPDFLLHKSPETLGISIVIPTYNRITECLACVCHLKVRIRAPKDQWEVIVVADGCTDGTGEFLSNNLFKQKGFENFKVVWTDKEPGRYRNGGWSRNAGARAARFSHITFCDTDIYHLTDPVTPSLTEIMEGCKDLIVGYMYYPNPNWSEFPPREYNLISHPMLDQGEACWMVIKKSDFVSIGGNSEKLLKWGCEDTDLLNRLIKRGFKRKRLQSIISTLAHEFNEDHKPNQLQLVIENTEILKEDFSVVRNEEKPDWGKYYSFPPYPQGIPDFSKVN